MQSLVSSQRLESKPHPPGYWPQGRVLGTRVYIKLNIRIMERNEGWEAGILSMYLKIQFQMSKSKFLKSCISEGFLPNGVRGCFSLAMDVNNQGLIQSIEEEMDIHSSRLLDRIYIHSQELEIQLKTQRDEMIRTIL